MKGKRNEVAFQIDKECLKTLKQREDNGELMLYYFDESGFSTTPCVPYGWQRRGETKRIPCHRSKRMNVLGFLSRNNDLFFHTSEGSVTTDTVANAFDAFAEAYAKQYEITKVPCLVVLDNASIHRSGAFKGKMADWQLRGVCLHFLPPYSPELNLIEILWRKIKYEWLRRATARLMEDFGTPCHQNRFAARRIDLAPLRPASASTSHYASLLASSKLPQ